MNITKHAYKRAHQRLGIGRQALNRMAAKALLLGDITHVDHAMYITYSGRRYVFDHGNLVTVY